MLGEPVALQLQRLRQELQGSSASHREEVTKMVSMHARELETLRQELRHTSVALQEVTAARNMHRVCANLLTRDASAMWGSSFLCSNAQDGEREAMHKLSHANTAHNKALAEEQASAAHERSELQREIQRVSYAALFSWRERLSACTPTQLQEELNENAELHRNTIARLERQLRAKCAQCDSELAQVRSLYGTERTKLMEAKVLLMICSKSSLSGN